MYKAKRVIILALCALTVFGVMTLTAQASVGSKQVTIVFANIKLVLDGKQITVKNEANETLQPFVMDGVVYIPARTLGDILSKTSRYDSKSTSYLLTKPTTNPIKWVPLYDRPYTSTSSPNRFYASEEKGIQYLGGKINTHTEISSSRYQESWSVTYPLNAAAQKVSGTICKTPSNNNAYEAVYEFYDNANKLLYKSPIMTSNINDLKFEFNTGKATSLTLKITLSSNSYFGNATCRIKDMQLYTTDYIAE